MDDYDTWRERIAELEEKLERAEHAMDGYAIIHVRVDASESWPVVARVPGGWQSGTHHYPDSTVLDVRGLTAAGVTEGEAA